MSALRRSTVPMTPTTISVRSFLALVDQRLVVADDDLRHAVAVADVDEDDGAHVADAVDPAEQDGRLADVGGPQRAAGMGSTKVSEWLHCVDSLTSGRAEAWRQGAAEAARRREISAGACARGTVTWVRFVKSFRVTVPVASLVVADQRGNPDADGLGVLELLARLVDLGIEDDARPGAPAAARSSPASASASAWVVGAPLQHHHVGRRGLARGPAGTCRAPPSPRGSARGRARSRRPAPAGRGTCRPGCRSVRRRRGCRRGRARRSP